jgi:hypothetical protein
MSELLHRVKIFVYRLNQAGPSYLLLRGSQGIESFWSPAHGPLGFGEKLETAIRREVMEDVGLARPAELLDLQLPHRWLVGDEEVIEWNYGYRTPPEENRIELDERWAEFRWEPFSTAYPALELDHDRAAIMRLHTLLSAA